MSPSRLLALRVIGSVIVVVIAMLCAAYLLLNHVDVPAAYWGIAGVAVGGIVGAAGGAIVESRNGTK
jgi:hypothetical protein